MTPGSWIAAVGLGLPVYSYLAYPVVLFALASAVQAARDAYFLLTRRERRRRAAHLPTVTVIIAAYNEAELVGDTLACCLEADYPRERLQVILGSDGSTDGTVEAARRIDDERLSVLEFSERRGKLAVLQDCAAHARSDILAFTDANTLLSPDSISYLVRHFSEPAVGAVCGELRLIQPDGAEAAEGGYWRYEAVLKILESRVDSVLGANGAIYALRRELFPRLETNLITEDFVIPMKVRERGLRVVYDPEAVASELAPSGAAQEFRRRVRIGAGNWQALGQCWRLLLPWRGFVAFSFWSHKVIRWFTPLLLMAALAASALMLDSPTWQAAFVLQLAFYGLAGVGALMELLGLRPGPLGAATYFVTINAALAVGMVRGMLGLQQPAWRRTGRRRRTAGEDG